MKKVLLLPVIFLLFTTVLFFHPFFFQGLLPVPSDTIVGMYNPFRDFYAKDYPRGIPFKNFQITDPVRQQYPWKYLSVNEFKKMQVPTWNPYNFAGTPHLANFQSAVFYPLNILFFILPFHIAWGSFILLQPMLAMVFMYLFLTNLKLRKASSLLGAVSFGFCGFFVSWMEWSNVVSTGLWLPLMLFLIDKILTAKKTLRWNVLLILSLACSFLAGHLQVFFYVFVVSIFYFFARWFQAGKSKKILRTYFLIHLFFVGATFFQWYPTLQFIGESARNLDQDWHNPGWFVPWQNLIQFIAPDFFGNPSTLNYWGVWNYGEFIGYIGIIPLLFALYAMLFVRRKMVWFFSLLLLVSLLFALPTLLAKVPFKFEFPFLSTSQPTRLIFLADVALCILAAFGFELFLRSKKKMLVPLTIIGTLLLLMWGFAFFNDSLPANMQTLSDNLNVTKNNLKLPSLLFVVALIIFAFYFFGRKVKNAQIIFIVLVLVITIADLYRFSSKYLTFAEQKYLFPDTKILAYLQKQHQPFRVISNDSRIFPPNFSLMYHIQTPDGYDPLYLRRYAEFSASVARGAPNIDAPFGFNRIITIQSAQSELTNLLNVKYVMAFTEIHSPQYKKLFKEGETTLYQNKDVLPRAFFVNTTVKAQGKQDAINKVFEYKRNLNNIAIVESDDFNKQQHWNNDIFTSRVWISDYQAQQVTIDTENTQEGFLVLSDTYYPTWHAKICTEGKTDCKETPIYLTDYTFRGVKVPSGKHSIIFYNSLL